MFKIFVIFSFVSIWFVSCLPVSVDDDLLAVAVLFRHGDRTPLRDTWPTDKYYKNSSLYPEGLGQLNNQGKLHHYELGRWFRERYSTLLPTTYLASDIYVKSTDYDRTLMSAQCNLAGLYPPNNTQIWNQDLIWQPIPIHTTALAQDPVLADNDPCPKYSILYNELMSLPAIQIINEEHDELLKNLTLLTGYNITSFTDLSWIHSQVSIYKSYGLDYPSWVDQYWKDIVAMSAIKFQLPTLTSNLARLREGPFFDYLLSFFDGVLAKTRSTKFLMLSAHDTTVANALNAMIAFNDAPPEFTSAVIWELWQNARNQTYINVYFKNSTHLEPLNAFECRLDCEYSDFKRQAEYVAADDATWKNECAEKLT